MRPVPKFEGPILGRLCAAIDSVTTCSGSGPGPLPAVVSAATPGDTIWLQVDFFGTPTVV